MTVNEMVNRVKELLNLDSPADASQRDKTTALIDEACSVVERARHARNGLQSDLRRHQEADLARALLLARDRNE